jgi:long-chain acyl-CoA synthetase
MINDRSHPRHLARLSSVGVPFAGVQVRLVDEAGRPVPAGEIGEVCVKGDTVMAGYWQDAQASARALRDGWLWTGDLGVFDEEGFLTLKDRSKDLIISGGSNIYPREVEEVLLMHPDVAEVSVIGRPDPEWGEVVVACVVGRAGFCDAHALDAHCLAHIARFKRPKHYQFLSELPKNAYGKVLKTELRTRFALNGIAGAATN